MIGGDGDNIAARRANSADHGNHRFFRRHPAQAVIDLFRTGGGAAGAVDADDDRFHIIFVDQIFDGIAALPVLRDEAVDGQTRHMAVAGDGKLANANGNQGHDRECGEQAPQDQAAL